MLSTMSLTEEIKANIAKLEAIAQGLNSTSPAYRTITQQLKSLRQQLEETQVQKNTIPSKAGLEINDLNDDFFFQAIGVVKGKLIIEETQKEDCKKTQFKIAIANTGKTYPLYYPRSKKNLFKCLCLQAQKNPETLLYFLVYPKLLFIPKQKPELVFEAVSWQKTPFEQFQENHFVLRGMWQFIPQYKFPVVSINRNQLDKKNREALMEKGDNFKGAHVPLLWKEGDVSPYRHNPKLLKEDKQMERYFIQVVARFIPKIDSFGFVKLLNPPTLQIPRYLISSQKMEQRKEQRKTK